MRSDAKRNVEAILSAAMRTFSESGVDAPAREVAKQAGVGVGTLYRHFPRRPDLIEAIIQNEVEKKVEEASGLIDKHDPYTALVSWMKSLVDLAAAKKGLAAALHSGEETYKSLPEYVLQKLGPVMETLLSSAAVAGAVRKDHDAKELVLAVLRLAAPASEGDVAQARRMVELFANGLRTGVTPKRSPAQGKPRKKA